MTGVSTCKSAPPSQLQLRAHPGAYLPGCANLQGCRCRSGVSHPSPALMQHASDSTNFQCTPFPTLYQAWRARHLPIIESPNQDANSKRLHTVASFTNFKDHLRLHWFGCLKLPFLVGEFLEHALQWMHRHTWLACQQRQSVCMRVQLIGTSNMCNTLR